MADEKLVQALDDLLVVYDFLLRGERAEGDRDRLAGALRPALKEMNATTRGDLFASFTERAKDEGWLEEGIDDFLAWLADEIGLDDDPRGS